MKVEDKRLFERVKKEIPIKLIFLQGELNATVVDLSGGGAGVILPGPLRNFEEVEMVFTIPEKEDVLRLKGRVVWAKKTAEQQWQAGVRIVNPSLFTVSNILSYTH